MSRSAPAAAVAPAKLVDKSQLGDGQKLTLECDPFKDNVATIVCSSCFAYLTFPGGSARVQCGRCNSIMSSVQAKCGTCATVLKIPLSAREVSCSTCKHAFTPQVRMRVQVEAQAAGKVPPPITVTVTLDQSVGFCAKDEFASRIIRDRPLSSNLPSWEQAAGARFQRVLLKNAKSERLDASKSPAENGLQDGDSIVVAKLTEKAAGSADDRKGFGSSVHSFESKTFTTPTNCSACEQFIWGVFAQGKCCVRCGFAVHHRCADKVSGMCDAARRQLFSIVDFNADSDDEGDAEKASTALVVGVPVEDPVAFMASLQPQVPPECDPEQMASLAQLATYTDEQISAAWLKYDADGSGHLERKEARKFLTDLVQSFGEKPSDAVLEALMKRLDSDGSGTVSWDEFVMFFYQQQDVAWLGQFAGRKELADKDYYDMWEKIDVDGSGELETNEVVQLLAALGGLDPSVVKASGGKRHPLSSYLQSGKNISWDTYVNVVVPIIQSASAKKTGKKK
jgi:LSD1 subclass zinc finger protein